ncbi:MAG TPA: pyrimidine dimer DNA glycosylase/endonuclease V [Methanobacterium sp.]
MRLWSLHPKYLDSKGLVALWREGLLARAVLKGETEGYKNHPQLIRFKNLNHPISFIDSYLLNVYEESLLRSYKFNRNKIGHVFTESKINVTNGQIKFECKHLRSKLKVRDQIKYNELLKINLPDTNPIFRVVEGDIEPWEVIQK